CHGSELQLRGRSMARRSSLWLECCGILVGLVVVGAGTGAVGEPGAPANVVKVEGGQIAGTIEDGVRSYKGIPYAAPPIGSLRWKPPQPVVAWSGIKKGDAVGAACPHLARAADSPFPEALEMKSEDCLYLNIWTAAKAGDRRPVMVWYHG